MTPLNLAKSLEMAHKYDLPDVMELGSELLETKSDDSVEKGSDKLDPLEVGFVEVSIGESANTEDKELFITAQSLQPNQLKSDQLYKIIVEKHLNPLINNQELAKTYNQTPITEQPRSSFLQKSKVFFQSQTLTPPFSEKRLQEIYIHYALLKMHERFAILQPKVNLSTEKPLKIEDRITRGLPFNQKVQHCKKLTQALKKALLIDFRGSETSLPSDKNLSKKAVISLNRVYQKEMICIADILINAHVNELFINHKSVKEVPSLDCFIQKIYTQIQTHFPSNAYTSVETHIINIAKRQLDLLKFSMELKQLFILVIDSLYSDPNMVFEKIPLGKTLFNETLLKEKELEFLQIKNLKQNGGITLLDPPCTNDEYETIKETIIFFLDSSLIPLKNELNPRPRISRAPSKPFGGFSKSPRIFPKTANTTLSPMETFPFGKFLFEKESSTDSSDTSSEESV